MTSSSDTAPLYSICMCNYNMENTLEPSLESILSQLDERYEVVLADDGSTDRSVEIIESLQKKYANLRLLKLKRDKNRKLGFTRNVTVEEAKGEYVMLHLDCDDVYANFIDDFVKVFHQIEEGFDHDVLVSGEHINMARKSFLLSHGPYRNLQRCQDRDLWYRLAASDAYISLVHKNFVTRIKKDKKERLHRSFYINWEHMLYDFRRNVTIADFLRAEKDKRKTMSAPAIILRMLYIIPAYIVAKTLEPITYPNDMDKSENIAQYREKARKTFAGIMKQNAKDPDFSVLSPAGKTIFDV